MRSNGLRSKLKRPRSEDYLKDLRSVTILLENGERVRLDIEREVRIPIDPDKLYEAARTSPARLAFWAYQTERALRSLRIAERECARAEGYWYQVYRRVYEKEECVDPTEAMLRASLDQDRNVKEKRIAVSSRKTEYGTVRAVRDAIEQRTWMLRAMLQHRET